MRFGHHSLALLLVGLLLAGCQKPAPKPAPAKPPEVVFALPITKRLTRFEEFSGRTWPSNQVEIRSRVTGYLKEACFTDGADAKAGDLLFQLDDLTYKAMHDNAKATLNERKAQRQHMEAQHQRAKKLFESRAVSQDEYEAMMYQAAQMQAAESAAQAALELTRLNLEFTSIRAPIHGRISRRLVDPGNLVKADDTLLATVIALDPIDAYFEIDERMLIRLRRMVEAGKLRSATEIDGPIQVALVGETKYTMSGQLNWVDNHVDGQTGTLRARVRLANPGGLLSPGMYVKMRAPIGIEEEVLLIPEEALASDQGQRFVYIINDQDEIEYRRVETGWLTEGLRVIETGLSAGDRILVRGHQRVKPKAKVAPRLLNGSAG